MSRSRLERFALAVVGCGTLIVFQPSAEARAQTRAETSSEADAEAGAEAGVETSAQASAETRAESSSASTTTPAMAESSIEGQQSEVVQTVEEPPASSESVPTVVSVDASERGLRFRCTSQVQSVSGRLDFRGRVVVTIVGQKLASDLMPVMEGEQLASLDGSDLLERLVFEPGSTSSGLQLVTVVLTPRTPVSFKVTVEETVVVLDLEAKQASTDGSSAPPSHQQRDAQSGRRVLTDADLEPIEAPAEAQVTSDAALAEQSDAPLESSTEADQGAGQAPQLDLGEPGAWLDRLAEAAGTNEVPAWDPLDGVQPELLSARELSNRERALQESLSRRLETAEQDLRAARAESAELRIDLARANQQLDIALEQLDTANRRIQELEALVPQLRSEAVASRTELERSRSQQRASDAELDDSNRARRRLEVIVASLIDDRAAAQAQVESLTIEADALRLALNEAETELVQARMAEPAEQQWIELEENALAVAPADLRASELGDSPSLADRAALGSSTAPESAVRATLSAWAQAWSAQDVDAYVQFYSRDLITPYGSFEDWRSRRAQRLADPEWIEVEIDWDTLLVTPMTPSARGFDRRRASFLQSYRSPDYQDAVQKVLVLVNQEGDWRIEREQAAAVVSMIARSQ